MAAIGARIAVAGVCLDVTSYNALTQFVMGTPGAIAVGNLDRYLGSEREIARLVEAGESRVCVIDYDQNTDEAIWITDRLHAEYPDIAVFAVSARTEPERIIAAMRAGCAEYLVKPLQNERVLEGLAHVQSKQKERGRTKSRGRVLTVVGAKGGTGVTTLALHLALELRTRAREKTLLIDQHPSLGDASLYLGSGRHQYSFYELASNTDRLDEELLHGFLLHHDGLDVLDSPELLKSVHYAPPVAVEHTLAFLAELYEFIVVDSPPGLSDLTLACASQSDQIAIVLTAELPAVRNTARYIEHLTDLGFISGNILVVVNRYQKKGPLTDDKIEKALQRPISVRIPNSYQEVIRAINSGIPLVNEKKSEFTSAIRSWAQEFAGRRTVKGSATADKGENRSSIMSIFGK